MGNLHRDSELMSERRREEGGREDGWMALETRGSLSKEERERERVLGGGIERRQTQRERGEQTSGGEGGEDREMWMWTER